MLLFVLYTLGLVVGNFIIESTFEDRNFIDTTERSLHTVAALIGVLFLFNVSPK